MQWENNTAAGDALHADCPTYNHLASTLAKLEEETAIASEKNIIKGRKDKGTASL